MLQPSHRGHVEPFRVMQMLDVIHRRRTLGKETLMLCVGQPATGAPQPALETLQAELFTQPLGYTEVIGDIRMRTAVANWHAQTYGTTTTPEQVVITTGSSGAFTLAFLALLDHGDTVAITAPGYPAYRNILKALGANVHFLPVGQATRFQPTAAMLEACKTAGQTPRMVIVTSPGNPTGTIIDPEELQRIADWCETNNCVLISDEDYHGISFGRPTATARAYSDQAISIGTLSKYFSMTGWRVGWMIVPPHLVETLENLQASLALCAPAPGQVAGREAFSTASKKILDAHVEQYAKSRTVLLNALPAMGLTEYAEPDGGLYLWLNVAPMLRKLGIADSETLAHDLVERIGVAVAPGIDFDPIDGHNWVRISLCASVEDTTEACRRLIQLMNNPERAHHG